MQSNRRRATGEEGTMFSKTLISPECISSGKDEGEDEDEEEDEQDDDDEEEEEEEEEEEVVSGTHPPLSCTLYSYSIISSPLPSSMVVPASGLYKCWGHWPETDI